MTEAIERPTPGQRGRPASIADVAAMAGVSVPTVSRVLTGAARVSPKLRERVEEAIGHLDYRPNENARSLVSGRSPVIAVLSSDTTIYGYSTTIRGIEQAARDAGFGVAISVLEGSEEGSIGRSFDTVLRQRPSGLLVLTFDPIGVAALERVPDWIPVAAISGLRAERTSQALLDETAGGVAATEYLLSLGHRTVHHLSVPPSRDEDGRTSGWRSALVAAGRSAPEILPATWDARSGVEIGRTLARRPDVTAVFCGNDEVAMGVVSGLLDVGLRVPDDVSVVGFDDHPLAAIWRPALTTVAQDFDDLGRRALGLLLDRIGGDPEPRVSTASPRLIVRESTAPPPSRSGLR